MVYAVRNILALTSILQYGLKFQARQQIYYTIKYFYPNIFYF